MMLSVLASYLCESAWRLQPGRGEGRFDTRFFFLAISVSLSVVAFIGIWADTYLLVKVLRRASCLPARQSLTAGCCGKRRSTQDLDKQ